MSILATQNILGGNAGAMRPTNLSVKAADYAFSGKRKNYTEYLTGTLKRGGAVRDRSGTVSWTDPSSYEADLAMPDIINQPPPPYDGNTGVPLRPGGYEDEQVQYSGEAPSSNSDADTKLGQVASQLGESAEGDPVITHPDASSNRSGIQTETDANIPTTSGGPSLTYGENNQYSGSETTDVNNTPTIDTQAPINEEIRSAMDGGETSTSVDPLENPAMLGMMDGGSEPKETTVESPGFIDPMANMFTGNKEPVVIYEKSEEKPPLWNGLPPAVVANSNPAAIEKNPALLGMIT